MAAKYCPETTDRQLAERCIFLSDLSLNLASDEKKPYERVQLENMVRFGTE